MGLSIVFLGFFLFHSANSQLKWVELKSNSTPPAGRRDAGIGYDASSNQVAIFGGKAGSILGDTWLFNITSMTWLKVADTKDKDGNVVPAKRFSMVYGSQNNYFYVSTGEGSARVFFDDVNRFDFTTRKWEVLNTTTSLRPEKRYGSGGGVHPSGTGLYVTHGFSGVRYSNTLKFTFQTQKWELKFAGTNGSNPNLPHERCLHSSAMTKADELVIYGGCLGFIIFFFGGSSGKPCPADDGWKYDGNTNTWTKLKRCASPRLYSAMAMLPSNDPKVRRVVLYGGNEKSTPTLSAINLDQEEEEEQEDITDEDQVDREKEQLYEWIDTFDGGDGFNAVFFRENAKQTFLPILSQSMLTETTGNEAEQEDFQAATLRLSHRTLNVGSILYEESRMWLNGIHSRLAGKVGIRRPYFGEITRSIPYDIFLAICV
ncbi:hypothetical protein QZH41_008991, partial [Actinostola sp. cb2023]